MADRSPKQNEISAMSAVLENGEEPDPLYDAIMARREIIKKSGEEVGMACEKMGAVIDPIHKRVMAAAHRGCTL